MIPIVPAVIPSSASFMRELLPNLHFSPEIHVDVVDGQFVPFTSWPYEPVGVPVETKSVTDSFTLEVDLMVNKPLQAGKDWLEAGADMLVFHIETVTLNDFKEFAEQTKISIGISALNDTALENLFTYADYADYIQLMGIAKIGAQGQSFDERVLERIEIVKRHFPRLPISVDGSVNKDTIKRLSQAGVDRLICGSAIVKAKDPKIAHYNLSQLLTTN